MIDVLCVCQVFLHIQERVLEQHQAQKDAPFSSITYLPTKSDRCPLLNATAAFSGAVDQQEVSQLAGYIMCRWVLAALQCWPRVPFVQ